MQGKKGSAAATCIHMKPAWWTIISHPDNSINNHFSLTGSKHKSSEHDFSARVHVMVQSVSLLGVGDVWWPSEECKHELTLGRVLTAATPWLEQRFDADLKEYGILKAQHGVPPSYGSGQETIFTWLFPQFCLSKVWLHWDVIKKEMYIIHIWGFPLDQRWKLPSTGDR